MVQLFLSATLMIFGSLCLAAELVVGKVIAVQDGDTLTLVDEYDVKYRVRIAGIDAPEKNQPWGSESTQYLSSLVLGKLLSAECPKLDRYQRKVCNVYLDGIDIGLQQLQKGYAWHYKKYEHEQAPQTRATYSEAEMLARADKSGLWQDSSQIPPWTWRDERRSKPILQMQ